MKSKKVMAGFALSLAMAMSIAGCGKAANNSTKAVDKEEKKPQKEDDGKLSIVCTNFAEYDFARQIAGDKADLTLLLKPGAESHSYEPTPQDIMTIQESDIFMYVGGDSDEWVEEVLESMDTSHMQVFKLMDSVELMEETIVEGMQEDDHDHDHEDADHEKKEEHDHEDADHEKEDDHEDADHEKEDDHDHEDADHEKEEHDHDHGEGSAEMDEHVWTSPVNAIKIVEDLSSEIVRLDSENKSVYEENTKKYVEELKALDKSFRDLIAGAARKEIIVGDRFPFAYFCKEYGLTYYAAFPGCSTDTDADASTVAFLIDKVKSDKIPVVFHIELSNEQMANSIAEATGAKSELLNAVHNISDSDFKAGVTYIDLMNHNVEVLKEALN
ncbi:MAG TPA: metal ABC transporter substrate-binding protein [Lachnospiraceae bacterium]